MKSEIPSVLVSPLVLFTFTNSLSAKDEIVKNAIISEGKKRSYYLFVPKSVKKEIPAPLLILLHGSGHDGKILIEHWQKFAEQERIILAGPNSQNSSQ